MDSKPIGIYEKAFPANFSWEERLELAAKAGFSFVEMSIDESEERLGRLAWSACKRAQLRQAIVNTGIPILGAGLSAHRKFPLGSKSARTREKSLELLRRTIDLCSDLGIRIIQVMGYDVFYEPRHAEAEKYFLEGLHQCVRYAAPAGVMLGLENVDCDFITSVEKLVQIIVEIDSPWLQAYPDIGNLAAIGANPCEQLPLARGRMVGVHVKDTLPGVYRGVPFQAGQVPFDQVFQVLAGTGFWGPFCIEMWSEFDTTGNPMDAPQHARMLVEEMIKAVWGD